MYEKIIKKSYPKKGVLLELVEHYDRDGCPRRCWKLWIRFKDNRSMEVHGILISKEEAVGFYKLVRGELCSKKEHPKSFL